MKTKTQIETWALEVIEARTADNQPRPEDSLVEFKRDWPTDAAKAARQIAAICNSARGDDVLWIIGFDETNGVVGCSSGDFQAWWPSVVAAFESEYPNLVEVVVNVESNVLVAMMFETDRAPYLVKNPQFGTAGVTIRYETPYRSNASTNSATRSQLISILGPQMRKPEFEFLFLHGELKDYPSIENPFSLCIHTYITPTTSRLVIPAHRSSVKLLSADGKEYNGFRLVPSPGGHRSAYNSEKIYSTPHELVMHMPGLVHFKIYDRNMKGRIPDWVRNESFRVQIILNAIEYDLPIKVEIDVNPHEALLTEGKSKGRSELTQVWRTAS